MPRLVGAALAVLTLILLLPAVPNVGATASAPWAPHAAGIPSAPIGPMASATGAPPVALPPIDPAWEQNVSLSPAVAAALPGASVPISALSANPSPHPPPTVPVVMTFLTNSTNCCVSAVYAAPVGSWGMIVLNYTGEAVGGVYDSSFRAYIDQAQVFFGTTPEYGIWYDTRDVTQYVSLLQGNFNFTFLLGAATTGGYFETSVSLSFYPVPAGASPPTEPNLILPLWSRVFVSTTSPFVYDMVTIPTNVTNATLEMWTYGFGPDEFWYAAQPNYRQVDVALDGVSQVGFVPFQFINTGGNDLFAWRPITGVDTLSNRPYEIPVTAALGAWEGTHNLTVTISGVTSGSSWLVGGSLLLYTNSSVTGATAGPASFVSPTPTISTDHHSYYDQTGSADAVMSSTITSTSGSWSVTMFSNNTFTSNIGLSTEWNNLSALEGWSMTQLTSDPTGLTTVQTSLEFPLQMDLGSVFVPNAGQGSSYPIYGNVTDFFLNVHQEWNEVTTVSNGTGSTAQLVWSRAIDHLVTGGNNEFIATEKLISANGAELTGITFVQSATTNQVHEGTQRGPLTWNYNALLIGNAYQPPGPNEVETVLVQTTTNPLDAALSASSTTTEVGASVVFTSAAVGGTSPYSYLYSGLPAGCASQNAARLTCVPTAPGTAVVSVTVSGDGGSLAIPSPVVVLVVPGPTLNLTGNRTPLDAGGIEVVAPTVVGGIGPFSCTWSALGSAPSTGPCQPMSFGPLDAGNYSVTVQANDAMGVTTANRSFSYQVYPVPTVRLASNELLNVTVGSGSIWTASVVGGAGPFDYVWYVNGTIVQNGSIPVYTLVPQGTGTYLVSVFVTDAAGARATSMSETVTVTAAPSQGNPGSTIGAALNSTTSTVQYLDLVVGLVIGAVVGAVLGLLLARRKTPPQAEP